MFHNVIVVHWYRSIILVSTCLFTKLKRIKKLQLTLRSMLIEYDLLVVDRGDKDLKFYHGNLANRSTLTVDRLPGRKSYWNRNMRNLSYLYPHPLIVLRLELTTKYASSRKCKTCQIRFRFWAIKQYTSKIVFVVYFYENSDPSFSTVKPDKVKAFSCAQLMTMDKCCSLQPPQKYLIYLCEDKNRIDYRAMKTNSPDTMMSLWT